MIIVYSKRFFILKVNTFDQKLLNLIKIHKLDLTYCENEL